MKIDLLSSKAWNRPFGMANRAILSSPLTLSFASRAIDSFVLAKVYPAGDSSLELLFAVTDRAVLPVSMTCSAAKLAVNFLELGWVEMQIF
ncbi:hypothetical protein BURK_004262 [Burkholderia sp. SJ98]|nr:hypothetical protein BURK_004262 [Burkholderia sp. SJ98]